MIEEDDFEQWRLDTLRMIKRMWWLFAAVVAASCVVLPWRLGWRGVPTAVWMAFWCAWARLMPWFVTKMRKIMDAESGPG